MTISRAIVNDLFPPRESARVLSLLMIMITVTPIIAPVLGSLILALAHWRVIFLLVLLFALVCIWMVWHHVPETLDKSKQQPLSLASVWRAYSTLMRQWQFIRPALVGGLSMASLFAFITASPFVFMGVFGASEQQYAWIFGLVSAGLIVGSQLNRMCLRRWSSAQVLGVALAAGLATSLLLLALLAAGRARAAFWAGVAGLLWFSHAVMLAWVQPKVRGLAWAAIVLSVVIVVASSLPGLHARFMRR